MVYWSEVFHEIADLCKVPVKKINCHTNRFSYSLRGTDINAFSYSEILFRYSKYTVIRSPLRKPSLALPSTKKILHSDTSMVTQGPNFVTQVYILFNWLSWVQN